MPMILALHDAEAYNGIVHLAERLIIPLFGAGLHERRHIDEFERIELNVEICRIREGGASVRCRHRTLLLIGVPRMNPKLAWMVAIFWIGRKTSARCRRCRYRAHVERCAPAAPARVPMPRYISCTCSFFSKSAALPSSTVRPVCST